MAARRASLSGCSASPISSRVQRARSTSGAPLVSASRCSCRSASVCSVLISLRSDENGTSPTRAKRVSSAPASSPALRAATISAPSVGSPCTVQRPSRSCSTALLARSATISARVSSVRSAPSMPPPSARATAPSGAYPVPAKSTRPLAVTTLRTVISLRVRVPVLSEAMTVAEPSVSTAARWRTMALRAAIRCTPSDRTAVTTAGRPSGTAATASATPRISTSKTAANPCTSSTSRMVAIITTAMATTMIPNTLPTLSSWSCSGVRSSRSCPRRSAIRPISVCMPVAVTTPRPCP